MADRSQHLEQIMENQTRFNLNDAIENWRQELTAQASLTAEVRRELETHLRDAIAEFQRHGANDEESFWLARGRVGQPQLLGEEFEKADPSAMWRKNMNKKIITLVAVAVIAAILLLLAIDQLNLMLADWLLAGQSHNLVSETIEVVATLLALPVRLYAFFIYGDHGSWSLPVLILLLAMSGLMWGVIVERTVWIVSKRNKAQ